jgi:Spy/CpxP family protein refolding chaperone
MEDRTMRFTQRLATVAVAAVLSLALAGGADAQKGTKGAGKGGKKGQAQAIPQPWLSKLNLTADQQAKVKDAAAKLQADGQAAAALTTPKEKKQASQKAMQEYQASVSAVLTPDQQKTLAAMRDEARQYSMMGPAGNQLVGLNLTEEQKTKVKEIAAKHAPEIDRIQASRKGASDKKAVQAELREANAKMLSEVKAVLTPEQQKQLPMGRKKPKN